MCGVHVLAVNYVQEGILAKQMKIVYVPHINVVVKVTLDGRESQHVKAFSIVPQSFTNIAVNTAETLLNTNKSVNLIAILSVMKAGPFIGSAFSLHKSTYCVRPFWVKT